uniref:Nudix (nucleoside diphosphate linked moiety X)-type motif 18 n=1 Tax=Neolamprologus brichardi TaxID=32507 RepID=A0A3Q4MI19_NEOBR
MSSAGMSLIWFQVLLKQLMQRKPGFVCISCGSLCLQVKEEAGFESEPVTLLLIQEQGPQWIRFIFLAKVTGQRSHTLLVLKGNRFYSEPLNASLALSGLRKLGEYVYHMKSNRVSPLLSGGSLKSLSAADQESLQASWWDRQSELQLRGRDILRLIESGLKYRLSPCHPVTLPLDLSCRHVVQRLVLVFVGAEEHIWVLLIRAPEPHLPTAAAVRTHAVTWAANMVVQEAMQSAYYDHDVNTLGVLSLQHNGRQNGKTDGVCFNTLVALTPDHVQRDEDGRKVEWTPTGQPPRVEHPRYVWHEVQKQTLREKLLEKTRNAALVPVHSLY